MITRNNALTAATLAAGATLMALPAAATSVGAVAQHHQGAAAAPNTQWIGLQAVSADGRPLGTVTKILAPAVDGGSAFLIVRGDLDGQVFRVPAAIATVSGNVVKLQATAEQMQKRS